MPHPPLIRKTDWAERLAAFFAAQNGETFAYGLNDCYLFVALGINAVNIALRAMTTTALGQKR